MYIVEGVSSVFGGGRTRAPGTRAGLYLAFRNVCTTAISLSISTDSLLHRTMSWYASSSSAAPFHTRCETLPGSASARSTAPTSSAYSGVAVSFATASRLL